jgi:hypothetical protein
MSWCGRAVELAGFFKAECQMGRPSGFQNLSLVGESRIG